MPRPGAIGGARRRRGARPDHPVTAGILRGWRWRSVETGAAAPEPPTPPDHRAGRRKILDIAPDELAAMAKNCEIRFDLPGYGIEPRLMTDGTATALQLSADERATYDRTVRKESAQYMAALRALYQELAGGDADNLDARALMMEILEKSPSSDVVAARRRLAEERAGLAVPPTDARNQSAVERLFRLQSAAGTTLEQLLAADLGADRAHQIRAAGWVGGDDSILHSCAD